MNQFLRTLVWIDDEIRPDDIGYLGNPFRSFFYPITQKFQKQGILVHLHPYVSNSAEIEEDSFTDKHSDPFDSAVKLAKKADIVILDWHLGRKDPQNSIRLLEMLQNESAIRYIVVLSQYAARFEEEIKKGGLIKDRSTDPEKSHLFSREGDSWKNGLGTHIIVMNKSDFDSDNPDKFCESIFDNVYTLMVNANPDYLHWAAIEIASKIRHSIPRWIQAIPCGTDAAVLSELISDRTEARAFIPEHLLEDLCFISRINTLESLASDNCRPEHCLNKAYAPQQIKMESERYKKIVHFSCDASKIEWKDIESIRSKSAEEDCRLFLHSQQSFAEFCENTSYPPEPFPTFGAIYIRNTPTDGGASDMNTIYLCLSQECDSSRSDSLMVLEGTVNNGSSSKEGITRLIFQGKTFGFLPEAKCLQSVIVSESEKKSHDERRLNGLTKIGHLRKATSRRILSRFWNHMSRSAVNLPRFTLKDRDKE